MEALRESEERNHAAFKTSPDAITISTIQGQWVDINDSFTKLSGYPREEIIGKFTHDIHIWKNPQDRNTWVKKLQENGTCDNINFVMRHKDGILNNVLLSATTITINHQPHILAIARNITELVKSEQLLRENEEWHRTILKTAMDGFWLFDMEGRLLEVNDTYSRMSGYSVRELESMNISDLETVETADDIVCRIRQIKTNGDSIVLFVEDNGIGLGKE